MEPKKKQVVRFFASVSRAVQILWPWLLDIGIVVFVAASLVSLMGCRSTTAAYGTQRTIRDSVVVKYKTVLRDSLRIKDSTVVSYSTVQRDSVVLRVDAETGRVVGKDTWHWRDTNTDRDHVAEVGRMVSKADSVAYGRVKTDSVATTRVVNKKAAETNETKKNGGKPWRRLLRSYVAGLLTGGILLLLWKYRRKILQVLKLLIKIVHRVLCL